MTKMTEWPTKRSPRIWADERINSDQGPAHIMPSRWRPSDEPQKWRSLEEFLALVSVDLRDLRPVNPTDGARAVFSVLNHFIGPGQIKKVREALPEDVRRIWPESKPRAGHGMRR